MSIRVSKTKIALAAFIAGTLISGAASAANQSTTQAVTAKIRFDTPLTMSKNSDIDFGAFTTPTSSKVYTITTAGVLSGTPATTTFLYGTPTAGSITVTGSTSQTISLSAAATTADSGVSVTGVTCNYNAGSETDCMTAPISVAAPGTGKTLLLGASVTADGSQAAAMNYSPTFTVTAIYN